MITESILLVCLTPQESAYIQGLLSAFEVEIRSRDVCQMEETELPADESICLVVIHVDKTRKKSEQEIRQIRKMVSHQIPILVLISSDMVPNIKDYLRAGADDYWVLPFDETAFIRFYLLLEWGEAVVQYEKEHGPQSHGLYKNTMGERILNRLQDGLRFFSTDYLMQSRKKKAVTRKWERIRPIGAGGFGEVWLIREQGDVAPAQKRKETLAVAKIPHSSELNIASLRAAAILKRLSFHPNVVRLIEVIKEEGKIILIQEYVEGMTMQALLEADMGKGKANLHSGSMGWKREDVFLQLLDVMTYTHQHKIMHRDIKPENIMITPSGELKLLDFGIAKEVTRQSAGDVVVGSLPFMAPEQLMGKSCIASDVWALGVMLYLLATDYFPFYYENEEYIIDFAPKIPPMSPRKLAPHLPEALETIILKALEKDVQKRYANAGELHASLLQAFPDFGKGNIFS